MPKRGKASVPKSGSRKRPVPSTKRHKRPGNGQPRKANKDTALLLQKKEVREDVGLIQTAVQERWPVPTAKRPVIVRRLLGIIRKQSVSIVTKRGELVDAEAPADTNAVLATRVLVQMEAQNQKDDFRGEPETKHEHQHIHIHDAGGTERPVDPEAEARRLRLSQLAESLRASSLVVDGVRVESTPAGGVDRNESAAASESAGESD